ncbi:MAG TPA: TadE family protein [Bryobacteraceae bacterium]|nr:TadE family protein [Bryobacteraceae bacterium]
MRRHGTGRTAGRRCAGTAIIEFALGSGVLLATFAGTFQFGYTFLEYNRLETAVVQGARFASLVPYNSGTTTPSNAFLMSVRNVTLYGNPDGGTSPVVPGLEASDVNLTVTFANGAPNAMTVSINGYAIDSVFGKMTMKGKPRVTYAYQGIWAPLGTL